MKTMTNQEYALFELERCLAYASETCDACESNVTSNPDACNCQTNGGDLVEEVCQAIANLRAEIADSQE